MSLVEVLQHDIDESYSFIVDNTQASVPIIAPVNNPEVQNHFDLKYFQQGDSFNMISVGIVMPENYVIVQDTSAQLTCELFFQAIRKGGGSEVLNPGGIILPFGQYELSYGAYFDNKFITDDYSY